MSLLPDDQPKGLQTWVSGLFKAASGGNQHQRRDPDEIIPPEKRKAAMSTLDPVEAKYSLWGLILATVAGVAIPLYVISQHRVTKKGAHSVAVSPDAGLVMAAILLFCALGFLAWWKRKRTLVAFSLFLIGFGFTLFIGLVGFIFILGGGWLMLRAWRINKYGTTNARAVAREAAARPRGKEKVAAKSSTKSSGKSAASSSASASAPRKPPTPSKRYTPKAPPRKKIPKPTE